MMKVFESQLIKFMMVGVLAMAVDASIFTIGARYLPLDYRLMTFFSWTFGFIANFFLCDLFGFRSEGSSRLTTAFRYYVTSLGSFGLQMAGMFLLIHYSVIQNWLAARISVASIFFVVNFMIIRRFVFLNRT